MPTVTIQFRRRQDPYTKPNAAGISQRDHNGARKLIKKMGNPNRVPRYIDPARIDDALRNMTLYPIGDKKRLFPARAVRQSDMNKLLKVQFKIFNNWLQFGKLPHAVFNVDTGIRGKPPMAYLEGEVRAIVDCLNSHYATHKNFTDKDIGLIRAIKVCLDAIRFKLFRDSPHLNR